MSVNERTPLIPEARRQVEAAMPSEGDRIKIAQALGALQAGKLPSQAQMSRILQVAIESDTLKPGGGPGSKTSRLGAEGQQVVDNFKSVLKAIKQWGEAKNGNDLLQNFFYNASTAEVDVSLNGPSAPSQKEMSRDAQRAIESFRTIASLMITSSAFRQLASDAILLTRDVFADAASLVADATKQAADKSRPSEKEKKQGVDLDQLQRQGKQAAKEVKSGKASGQARETLWDEVEAVREYIDEKLPQGEEARERVIGKLRAVITQAQENPEYRRSISAIVGWFKKYVGKAEDALNEAKSKSDISDEDEKVQQAGRDLKAFVEKVSNTNLDDVIAAAQKAAEHVRGNDKLSAYFKELDSFVHRLLYQPGYVASQAAYRKASTLYDDGQSLVAENKQWKADASELQKQLEAIVDGVANDGPTNDLVEAVEDLGESLVSAGKIGLGSLQPEGQGLYRDFVDVVLPRMIGLIEEIPVPRIEFKSEDIDLVIDDVKFETASFIPNSIRVVQNNDLRFTQGYATYASEYDASLRLRVEGVHFQASNIAFWVSRKTGLLPFEDAGLLDIEFGPEGISFDVTLENANEEDRETFFVVTNVSVRMSGFDFQVRENTQSFAAWFARPIVRAFIKRNLTSALESQIADYLREVDFRMYGVQQRAIAATNAKPSIHNFINAVVRDSIFPRSNMGPVKVKLTGVTKYGRRGEYVLYIGVDEELFPDQPPSRISNSRRQKLKARAQQASAEVRKQVRQAVGSAAQFEQGARKALDKGKKEANDLDAKKTEQQRRETKTEGWRSDAFDV